MQDKDIELKEKIFEIFKSVEAIDHIDEGLETMLALIAYEVEKARAEEELKYSLQQSITSSNGTSLTLDNIEKAYEGPRVIQPRI